MYDQLRVGCGKGACLPQCGLSFHTVPIILCNVWSMMVTCSRNIVVVWLGVWHNANEDWELSLTPFFLKLTLVFLQYCVSLSHHRTATNSPHMQLLLLQKAESALLNHMWVFSVIIIMGQKRLKLNSFLWLIGKLTQGQMIINIDIDMTTSRQVLERAPRIPRLDITFPSSLLC